MSYMDQCSTRRWVYHAVGTSVHSESCSTDSCHCTIWPKYSGQRCTYILLQVRNVLPPLVGHHDDSYTHVRQLLKARLFDNGCVTLSDFLFLWAVCKSSYLLICRGWCIYIYIYILQIGRTARLVKGIFDHFAATECRVLFTSLLAACILPACRVLRCQFAVGNYSFCQLCPSVRPSLYQFRRCLIWICYFAVLCIDGPCRSNMFRFVMVS